MKFVLFLALFLTVVTSLIPASSFALIDLNLDYPKFGNITLEKSDCESLDPGEVCGQNPNALIAWIYYFIVGIAGLAAFIMLVWGGAQWLTSGAIPSQAGEAKDKIRNAILGLLLVLASFLIIQVINPELTILKLPGFDCPKDTVCAGEIPTISFSAGGSGGATVAKLPINNASADGIYLCKKFECECEIKTGPCVAGNDPATSDFRFIDPTTVGVSTGPGTGGPGLADLGNWKDNVKSVAIKGSYDVLLADDPSYKGVVICFADNGMGGKLSEFERPWPNFGTKWHDAGAMSVKILPNGTCRIPGITLRNPNDKDLSEVDFWNNPSVFLFIQTNYGESGDPHTSGYVRYMAPRGYSFLGVKAPNPNMPNKDRRSAYVAPGTDAIRLYNQGENVKICFTDSIKDLSVYSLDLANPNNDLTDDIGFLHGITDSQCPPGKPESN